MCKLEDLHILRKEDNQRKALVYLTFAGGRIISEISSRIIDLPICERKCMLFLNQVAVLRITVAVLVKSINRLIKNKNRKNCKKALDGSVAYIGLYNVHFLRITIVVSCQLHQNYLIIFRLYRSRINRTTVYLASI